jgi:hypothetical protein
MTFPDFRPGPTRKEGLTMTRKQDAEVSTARRFGYTPAAWKKARAKFNARMGAVFSPEFRERIEREIAPVMQDRAERAAYAHKLLSGIESAGGGSFETFSESVYGYLRLRGMTWDEIDGLSTETMTKILEEDARKKVGMTAPAPSEATTPRLVIHANGTVLFDGTTYRFKSGRFTEVLAEIVRGGGGYVTIDKIKERAKAAGRPIGDPYSAIKRGEEEHPELVGAMIEKTAKGYALKVDPSAVRVDAGPTRHR